MQNLASKPKSFKDYHIDLNAISVEHLFSKYEEIGFLYPEKKKIIEPYYDEIKANWESILKSNKDLIWLLSKSSNDLKEFASITVVRNTMGGRLAQHLVSNGNPFSTLKIMLAAQNQALYHCHEHEIHACQNWFRPNNRYAFRVFGSIHDHLGEENSSIQPFHYLHIPQNAIQEIKTDKFRIEEVFQIDHELNGFIAQHSSEVFIKGEELDNADLTLKELNGYYEEVGLGRTRKILKFRNCKNDQIVGCVIANRAPLGLNFSFLGNRAYYFIDDHLDNSVKHELIQTMSLAIWSFYENFQPGFIPVVTNELCANHLSRQGAIFQRIYVQSIWLKDGFHEWYEHISSFISKIEKRYSRHAA